MTKMHNAALILIDLQNDFMPGGTLAVPHGNEVIPLANQLQSYFSTIIATQDWHPANHKSFAVNHPHRKPGETIELSGLLQILWPTHCVQNTKGAELVSSLEQSRINEIITKGSNPTIDSYSGFFDNGHKQATKLESYLRQRNIDTVYLCGVATDYCVKFTALDACQLGFKTYVIEDACRGVNLQPNDSKAALIAMQQAGATIINSLQIV